MTNNAHENTPPPALPASPTPLAARPLQLEDVQRVIGGLALEIERLRRENEDLRAHLAKGVAP